MSWFSDFVVTPGAGGVGAVVAAVLIGGSAVIVSGQRRTESTNALRSSERKEALDRWWTRYVWLISTEGQELPIEGRVQLITHLRNEARNLNAKELITAAESYGEVLNRWLTAALEALAKSGIMEP